MQLLAVLQNVEQKLREAINDSQNTENCVGLTGKSDNCGTAQNQLYLMTTCPHQQHYCREQQSS